LRKRGGNWRGNLSNEKNRKVENAGSEVGGITQTQNWGKGEVKISNCAKKGGKARKS